MEPRQRSSFQPAGAGALLVTTTLVMAGIGALAGWALGDPGVGAAAGTAAGIPAGVYVVYRRYREYFN